MTKEILKSENLVEIYENLTEFAKHNQNLGGQKAHRLIYKEFVESPSVRNGSKEMEQYNQGFDAAIKQVLSLIHKNFVP